MIRVKWILAPTNKNIIEQRFPELLKSRSKGENIAIIYTMIDYKFKAVHDEDNTLSFYPMRQNIKAYPREENYFGDDSSMFTPDDEDMCDTIIYEKTYLSSNNIT